MHVRAGEQTWRAIITMAAILCTQTAFLRDSRKVLYSKLVGKGKKKSGLQNKTKLWSLKRIQICGAVVAYSSNPSTQKQRQAELCESETSLVYRMASRTARTIQRNPVWKTKKERKKNLLSAFYII